jgi:hypothetical protein
MCAMFGALRAISILVGLVVGLVAAHAHAQDLVAPPDEPMRAPTSEPLPSSSEVVPAVPPPPSAAGAPRVAVLLLPTGDIDPSTTDALTELLIAAVASHGATQIVGKEELLSILSRDDASMLECVQAPTCLGIAGVALGLTEIVSGTLGRRDDAWIFVLDRIDVRSSDLSARVFRVVEGGLDALIDALSEATNELYAERVRPGRIVLHTSVDGIVMLDGVEIGTAEAGAAYRRDLVMPGAHELVLRAPGHATWSRTIDVEEGATIVLDAVPTVAEVTFEVPALTWVFGGAAIVAFGGGIALGVLSQSTPSGDATMREVFEFYDSREREAVAADILYGVGAASAATALVPLILALTAQPSPVAVLPRIDLASGTYGVTLQGGF